MPWQTSMVELLRVLVNDMGDTPTSSDETLQRVIIAAAFQVVQAAEFTQAFTVNIGSQEISPDPTDENTRDDSFVNLACLKAACIVNQGAAQAAAGQAIAVRDGTSAIDLRGNLAGRLAILKQGWCATYNQQLEDYLYSSSDVAGAAVMTPFRLYAQSYYTPPPYGEGALRGREFF